MHRLDPILLQKCLQSLENKVKDIQPSHLSFYLLILTSEAAQQVGVRNDAFKKLEQVLMKLKEQVSMDEVAKLCYSLTANQSTKNLGEYELNHLYRFFGDKSVSVN